jgi:hypothetical protein
MTMEKPFALFFRKQLIFTIILALAGWLILMLLPAGWRTPAFPYLVLFYFAVNTVVYYYLQRAVAKRFNLFVNYFLIATFLKLTLYVIVLLGYIFYRKQDAVPFAFTFLLLYMAYTVFEVIILLARKEPKP